MRLFGILFLFCLLYDGAVGKSVVHKGEEAYDLYHPYTPTIDDIITIGGEMTDIDWSALAQQDLMTSLNSRPKWKAAKNVIMFVGDGMGVSTLTAARFLKAQKSGNRIVDTKLNWETFSSTGIIKTYNTDYQTPDSAGTANAFVSGEKTRAGVIGVNQKVNRGNCDMVEGNELKSMLHHAIDEGKWTGLVTTARVTHATPAATYAHSADRYWESEWFLPDNYKDKCWDIARQLVHNPLNKHIRVILGGGRRYLLPDSVPDNEYPDKFGWREDGLDLVRDWKDIKADMGLNETDYAYVENLSEFNDVNESSVEYLMGLFERSHMKFESQRLSEDASDAWREPSLSEMVSKALGVLTRGSSGYFLFVEGGRIDHGHHDNNAYNALHDTLALDQAVQAAVDATDDDDTLILVTADHSHVFTIGGYPDLNTDILGTVQDGGVTEWADDDQPYLTLAYANGPGFYDHRDLSDAGSRRDLTDSLTDGTWFLQDAGVALSSETHGGEDVLVYARGPMSHLLTGQHEQHYIAHAVRYAACLGNDSMCTNPGEGSGCTASTTKATTSTTTTMMATTAAAANVMITVNLVLTIIAFSKFIF